MTRAYRTLVRGTLVQQSSLCVGGSEADVGGPDLQCARDGRGRLTIPGTGLAGAFVETAGRIFPDLLTNTINIKDTPDEFWNRVSGKAWLGQGKQRDNDNSSRQSVWHFYPSHLDEKETNQTEARQGVGIRQATGAAAVEAKALYDLETVPAGRRWPFFFEVDALRGGAKAEAVAFLALAEWVDGRCWLGASAARGLGWMTLEEVQVLRLPLSKDAIDAWPCNRTGREETFKTLETLERAECFSGGGLRAKAWQMLGNPPVLVIPEERFCYLTLDVRVTAGKHDPTDDNQYGLDTLSVGGHAALANSPLRDNLVWPLGKRPEVELQADEHLTDEAKAQAGYNPDAPVVTTRRLSGRDEKHQPFLPGGGIRGPLRHKTSAWHRRQLPDIPDPNARDAGKPLEGWTDCVSTLFGLTDQSARVLVRDGYLEGDGFKLVCFQHHAEDEFAGGVYRDSKFDRTAVLEGTFTFRIVVEAPCAGELKKYIDTLMPALRLAELGYVLLGGGKWRSHGWLKWHFTKATFGPAGKEQSEAPIPSESDRIVAVLETVKEQLGGSSWAHD